MKQILVSKKNYLDRVRYKKNPYVLKNFDIGIANRKEEIKKLRLNKPKRK